MSEVEADRGFYVHPSALVESERIGAGTRIWAFAHVQEGAEIGRDCNICDHCFIERNVRIGNDVVLKNGVSVWDKVTIEDSVFVGPNAVFTNDLRPRADPRYKQGPEGWLETRVRRGATIGANATIVCGIELGENCMVAAGSVVTRSVRPGELVIGVPARHAGWVCECGGTISDGRCTVCNKKDNEPDRESDMEIRE